MIKFTKDDANKSQEEVKTTKKKATPAQIYTAVMILGCILVTANGIRLFVKSFDRGDTTPAAVMIEEEKPEEKAVMVIDIDRQDPSVQEMLRQWEAEGKVVDSKAPSIDELDPEFQELYHKMKEQMAREEAIKQQRKAQEQAEAGSGSAVKAGVGAKGSVGSSISNPTSSKSQNKVSGKASGGVVDQGKPIEREPVQNMPDDDRLLNTVSTKK